MAVDFLAGMVPTADELQSLVPTLIAQGTAQDKTSSVSLSDSAISVSIDGLAEVRLDARWVSGGGGIRWAWRATGSVSMLTRTILSVGSATSTTATTHNVADLRHRQIATLGEEQVIAHYTNSGAAAIQEWALVDGVGELVFQFAQESSNASATTLNANSYATRTQIRTA